MFKTPHFSIHDANPVFDFELRRIKRLAQPLRLWRYSVVMQLIPSLILVALYLLSLNAWLREWNANGRGLTSYQSYDFFDALALWVIIFVAGAFLMALIGGWYYLGVTVNSINQQMSSGHWDQLRITPLSDEAIYEAKRAIGEVRAWRVMNIEVGVRLLLITLLVLILVLPFDVLVGGQSYFDSFSVIGSLLRTFQEKPLTTLIDAALIVMVAVAYICEPRWRMRALVAMGLAMSSRVRSTSMAALAAFFGLFGFHIAQAFWMWFTMYAMVQVSSVIAYSYRLVDYRYDPSIFYELSLIGLKVLVVGSVISAFYIYYRLVRYNSRQSTLRHAFRSEGDSNPYPNALSGAS